MNKLITSINKSNAARYTALFREAEKQKGIATGTITTLEDYFAIIEDLSVLNRKYTILPLDEEHLFIDANTRKITMPDAFKKNGIAVQGDQVAEIIYFKINRYFDATDLDTCEIFIQWEQINNSTGLNVSGVSTEYVRDIESDPDYLIFGWPIDSRITESAGSIKFSVRFIQRAENSEEGKQKEIVYSFSTLDAIATINPALDFDSEILVASDEINNMIMERFTNTKTNTGGIASEPIWVINLIDPADGDNIADLVDGSLELKAQAFPAGQGVLSYTWKKDGNKKFAGELKYEIVPKVDSEGNAFKAEENKLYYAKDINGEYSIISKLSPGDDLTECEGDIYQQFTTLIVDSIGEYQITATNTVALLGEGINTAEKDSNVLVIPGPVAATFENTEVVKQIMTEAADRNGYELAAGVKATVDPSAAHTYQWLKDSIAIEGATEATYNKTISKTNMSINEQGLYQLQIESTRNNAKIDSISSGIIITYPALAPQVTYDNALAYVDGTIAAITSFDADYQKSEYQNVSYQWYVVKGSGDVKIDGANSAAYTVTLNSVVTPGSMIYCEVTNNYNSNIQTTKGASLAVVNAQS